MAERRDGGSLLYFMLVMTGAKLLLMLKYSTIWHNNYFIWKYTDIYSIERPAAFVLNLTSYTQRLFDTRSLLELFIKKAMVFLH